MFANKQRRDTDKRILSDAEIYDGNNDDPSVINVKVASKAQLFSVYSYSGDKLNPEFSEYLFDRAKDVPFHDDITVKIHASEEIDAREVQLALRRHYRDAYKRTKKAGRRLAEISAVMTALGIIALTVLILIRYFFDNIYLTSIVEIAAWVFIWEAVDYFFLQRPVVKADCVLIQRIYLSKIEICYPTQNP